MSSSAQAKLAADEAGVEIELVHSSAAEFTSDAVLDAARDGGGEEGVNLSPLVTSDS